MRTRIKVGIGVVTTLAVVAASVGVGRARFARQIDREVSELLAAGNARSAVLTEDDLAQLPAPVQRWLRYSRVVGAERPATVRLRQEGQFRTGEGQAWMPFKAEQHYTTDPPGFLWSASIRMAPLITITGRDRYTNGTGDIEMRVLSLIPVANKSGGSFNQGELLRYLSEIGWFPAAAVSPYIAWQGLDDTTARATISHRGVTGSATFVFDAEGRLTSLVAERPNDTRNNVEQWTCLYRAYGEIGGVLVPMEGEAIWNYDSGDFTYIRLRIVDIEYNHPTLIGAETGDATAGVPGNAKQRDYIIGNVSHLVGVADHGGVLRR